MSEGILTGSWNGEHSAENPLESKLVLDEPNLEGVALQMVDFHSPKITVISGPRISVPAGVPDFRSPDIGLYHAPIEENSSAYVCDIFNRNYFIRNPKPLYEYLRFFWDYTFEPTISHYFVALLEKKNLLLRNYTLNMDDLEKTVGIPEKRLIQIYGTLYSVSCIRCGEVQVLEKIKKVLNDKKLPQCKKCTGPIKPDIVFYGDPLPERFYMKFKKDLETCELIIILGATLSQEPLATIFRQCEFDCPRLVISDVEPYEFSDFNFFSPDNKRDVLWLGDCDSGCAKLMGLLEWFDDFEALSSIKLKEEVEVVIESPESPVPEESSKGSKKSQSGSKTSQKKKKRK